MTRSHVRLHGRVARLPPNCATQPTFTACTRPHHIAPYHAHSKLRHTSRIAPSHATDGSPQPPSPTLHAPSTRGPERRSGNRLFGVCLGFWYYHGGLPHARRGGVNHDKEGQQRTTPCVVLQDDSLHGTNHRGRGRVVFRFHVGTLTCARLFFAHVGERRHVRRFTLGHVVKEGYPLGECVGDGEADGTRKSMTLGIREFDRTTAALFPTCPHKCSHSGSLC